jgi:tetratricopeptide (TPR) repeat protein
MTKSAQPRGGPVAVRKLQTLANRYSLQGKYRAAAACLREALRQLPPTAPAALRRRVSMWNDLGMVCKYVGNFATAERYYRLALGRADQCYQNPQRNFFLADLYHNLGGLEHSRRHFRRGESYTRKALQLRCKATGANSLGAASDMAALAALLDGQQRFAESESLYWKALRIYRREYGKSHPEIAVVLNNLAALFQATGRPSAAATYYQTALKMKRKVLGGSHPDVGVTLNNLGMLHQQLGAQQDALLCFEKAFEILRRALGTSHQNTRAVRRNLQTSKHVAL